MTHDLERFFATGRTEVSLVFDKLDALGVVVPKLTAIDFGCGIGRLTRAIAERFPRTIGIDVSPSMIQLAKTNDKSQRCEFVVNDVDDLAFLRSNSVGFVFSAIVLQHIPPNHSRRYILEFLRILETGGVAVFQIPSKAPTAVARRVATTFVPILYPLVPRSLVKLYRRLRYRRISKTERDQIPVFDRVTLRIYGIDRTDVEQIVRRSSAEMLLVESTDDVGKGWPSFRYFVRKQSGPGQRGDSSPISAAAG